MKRPDADFDAGGNVNGGASATCTPSLLLSQRAEPDKKGNDVIGSTRTRYDSEPVGVKVSFLYSRSNTLSSKYS